jgi:CheY-like chemotaxis protein
MSFCRILNVGPDLNVRGLLEGLAQSNERVLLRHIDTGALALDHLVGNPGIDLPDIVIVSFRLPVLTGLDFAVQMRSHEHLRSIPIMVWGPDIRADEIDGMHKVGVACVFLGEFDATHVECVRRYLGLPHKALEEAVSSPEQSRHQETALAKFMGDAQLGTMFTWAGCAPAALWLIAFVGRSDHAVDLLPLPVYAALICAGSILISSRTHEKKPHQF